MPLMNLLDASNQSNRNYALNAAKDSIITYSSSNIASPIVNNWIDRIYGYIGRLTNIKFMRVNSDAEFTLTRSQPDFKTLFKNDYITPNPGAITLSHENNKKQYGGVETQRTLLRSIAYSLGVSFPDGRRVDSNYTTNDTIMSEKAWDRGYDFGHTIFYTEADKNAIKSIFGSNRVDGGNQQGKMTYRQQRIEEDLLIGANGQVDIFVLTAKGMNYQNKASITKDPVTGLEWVNDYNVPTIVNFNPYEGDRILISRNLYLPENPINPDYNPPSSFVLNGITYNTNEYLNNLSIKFAYAKNPSEDQSLVKSDFNTIYNDAGKLMLNVNGTSDGNGPGPVPGNGQLLAFVDVIGGNNLEFKSEWLGLA